MKSLLTSTLIAVGIASACLAHGQLVFGDGYYSSSTPGISGAFYLDITTGNATHLWTGASNKKVTALAADNVNGILYSADNARFNAWNFGSVAAPTMVNGFYRKGTNGTTYATFVGGLAFAQGKLYAYTNYNAGGGSNVIDGIYQIDTTNKTSGTPNMSLVWSHPDLAYNFLGFDYDAENGLFYATNNPNNSSEAGIYSIDLLGTGEIKKIANFDSRVAVPDGLAAGGGHLWLTGKAANDTTLKIEGYDLATGTYDSPFEFEGFPTSATYTGATWAPNALQAVPEPSSFLALGGVLVLAIKRRKA